MGNFMMHICTVATLCFPEKTFPRSYYYCVQDENSLCLCFKNMYRTLFVAIFTSTFIFSMYDHIGLPGCVFPYLSKYKYQQSFYKIGMMPTWSGRSVQTFMLKQLSTILQHLTIHSFLLITQTQPCK